MSTLYKRQDDEVRGRHLVACQDIAKGSLIFAERPLVALQSLDNQRYASVCHGCLAFIGGPSYALNHRFRRGQSENNVVSNPLHDYTVADCRDKCGQKFCSLECERDTRPIHEHLCTGKCEQDHPLVEFKQFAVQTNEIFLLVAQWWVARHVSKTNEFSDFMANPWWDAACADIIYKPGGFGKALELETTLKKLCDDASDLLSKALAATRIPPISALQVSKIVGACEQNAIGIRQRHPLCRDVFQQDLRQRHHDDIVSALVETGFIGNGTDECDEQDDEETNSATIENDSPPAVTEVEEWDYNVSEIADFIASLDVKNTGLDSSNELDLLFPPLDGLAMYATICKMNHSCRPNVIVLYKDTMWGSTYPLTAFCVALRDISPGEELTISYVDTSLTRAERRDKLLNYGFTCECERCRQETNVAEQPEDASNDGFVGRDDIFGSEDDDDDDDDRSNEIETETDNDAAEVNLAKTLKRIKNDANNNSHTLPLSIYAPIASLNLSLLASVIDSSINSNDKLLILLKTCKLSWADRDYESLVEIGVELCQIIEHELQTHKSWPSDDHKRAYWCGIMSATIGLTHKCLFLPALNYLDKGIIMGLLKCDDSISNLVKYVANHYDSIAQSGAHVVHIEPIAIDEKDVDTLLTEEGLKTTVSKLENTSDLSPRLQQKQPFIVRSYASNWPATKTWTNVAEFVNIHGHRLVPVERGSIMSKDMSMKEEIMSIQALFEYHLSASSNKGVWSMPTALQESKSTVYLAQHPLLEQVPRLENALAMNKDLFGTNGPTNVNVWIGTGGTRTPLHFDSYDNFFVQLVGYKYIRLYSQSETEKLYVSKESLYGLQGNMSSVDCENEDWSVHPKAKDAQFTEAVLGPGDCLYIPSRTWHYVRSLTTSMSVNYWF